MKDEDRTYLPNSTWCFVCGEDNPAGLQTRFYIEGDMVKMPLGAQPHHCGYPNTVHGGIAAAAMDECMGWAAARAIGRMCLTGELRVRYLRRIPQDRNLTVESEVIKSHRRMVHVNGRLVDDEGTVYAQSEGRFMPMTPEQTLEVDDLLLYRGDEERPFAELREQMGE